MSASDNPRNIFRFLNAFLNKYGRKNNIIPHGIRKKTKPELKVSINESLDPCGIDTCVIGSVLDQYQYGKTTLIKIKSETAPKSITLGKFFHTCRAKSLTLRSSILLFSSTALSIKANPKTGKTKKTIPNIVETWCAVVVSASTSTALTKWILLLCLNQLYISGHAFRSKANPVILGNCPNTCIASTKEEQNTAASAAYSADL